MEISNELENSLERAFQEALKRKHEFVTPEHILYALLEDEETKLLLYECGGNIDQLKNDLEDFFDQNMIPLEGEDTPPPNYSIGSQFVLKFASLHVESSGKKTLTGENLLAAMFREKESHAAYFLEKQDISRLDVIRYISHGVSKRNPKKEETKKSQEGAEVKDPLKEYCIQLNEKAKQGKIDPLVGRGDELERTIHILARRKKNNPIFVGDAGVGKTAITEGLAQRIIEKKVPSAIQDLVIYSLDMGSLMAGTRFRGDFEERLIYIIEAIQNNKNFILFIDEIHTLIGAGAVSGGSLDASNMLKPALANGDIRCIGTTTTREYRSIFEKDHALARRFQRVNVHEPSQEESLDILKGLKKYYEEFHNVKYSEAALKSAVELSAKYINDRRLPDKAIDVIDEAGASRKLKGKSGSGEKRAYVTVKDIEELVSRIAKIPPQTVKTDDREKLKDLSQELKKVIFGQDEAVEKIATSIQMARAGLKEENKPVGSFIFAGPTGVGKTELAKQLSNILGVKFIRFDMSEYMEKHTVSRLIGSPPGYVGFDQGGQLTEAIHTNPHSVLLLDEIEKANEDIYNILLQVMDYASLTDANGRKIDFRQVILIMTTNQGAREGLKRSMGFDEQSQQEKSLKAIENYFSPEFRNRLSGIIQFNPLSHELLERIVEKALLQLEERLKPKKVRLDISDEAVSYLAREGYDPQMGARPIQRIIESEIAEKIAKKILFGELVKGGLVKIVMNKDKMEFKLPVNHAKTP